MKYLLLASAALLQDGRPRDIRFEEGAAIAVRPTVATGDRHSSCVVSFPEESIQGLVAAWSEADLSMERRGNLLFLKLLRPVEGDLHVIGASGTLYRLAVSPGTDTSVRILRPEPAVRRGVPALDLIRAMRLGRPPLDVQVRHGSDGVISRIASLEIRCRWVFESPEYVGFVLEARNGAAQAQRLDVSRLRAKHLVVAAAKDAVVPADGSTHLYLVFARPS